MNKRSWKRAGAFVIIALIAVLTIAVGGAVAAPASSPIVPEAATPAAQNQQEPISNDVCLACHNNPSLTKKLYDGTDLSLYVKPEDHANSVHGQAGLMCVQCHSNFDEKHTQNPVQYPGFQANDRRDVTLKLYPLCQQCHADQYDKAIDSVHGRAMQNGNVNAAVCVDCHTAHTVRRLTDPATKQLLPDSRIWIPETCAKCHSTIYAQYKDSVHGAALIQENNLDVPTCIDCHGVHNIPDPTTAAFRLKSPELCAKCHANASIMDKYGISTQVFNTYVADFHGTTVTLFQKESPDAPTNKPVCFDCHGVHDIVKVDDPQKGLELRQNILKRCQVCHPTATTNFSEAWMSHYIPSPTKYPVVYFVDLFYKFFIPGVLGGMAILVVLDVSSVVRQKRRKSKAPPQPPAVEPPAKVAAAAKPPADEPTAEPPSASSRRMPTEATGSHNCEPINRPQNRRL